jgi:AICAR transformylase/IMP cyclohydrolase PurH
LPQELTKVTLLKIDIGGISLIRAAAKNFKDTVIASVDEYSLLLDLIDQDGATTLADRKLLATKLFMFHLIMTHLFSTISIRMKLFSKQVLQMVKS